VKLGECYAPNPAWAKIADTTVRDISSLLATATVDKDIYCDNDNCLLWTDEAEAPTTVCVATDPNVYGNILWAKTDSGITTWADSNFSLFGFDIGGTHPSGLKVGNNSADVSSKNYLERNYSNTQGMFNAMDLCKAKGSGWRLPNILELDSIRDQAKGSAPYTRLPSMASANYWSSSENSSTNAYNLNFNNGNVNSYNKSNSYYVRCVREVDSKGYLRQVLSLKMTDYQHLPLYLKLFGLIKFLYRRIRSFPREYKYSFGRELMILAWECLDGVLEANSGKRGQEKNLKISCLSLSFDKLKIRLRMAAELKLISERQFVHLQTNYLKEIGEMIGGWLKWSNERNI
jgi:hypothetical protein